MILEIKKLCSKPWEGSYLPVWEEESREHQGTRDSQAHRAVDPREQRMRAANPVPAATPASGTHSSVLGVTNAF